MLRIDTCRVCIARRKGEAGLGIPVRESIPCALEENKSGMGAVVVVARSFCDHEVDRLRRTGPRTLFSDGLSTLRLRVFLHYSEKVA